MRLPLTVVAVSLLLSPVVAHAETAAPAQASASGRMSAKLPITPQPNPDQRLERVEAALVELDTQLRGLKAQGESLTGLNDDQGERLEDALARLDKTRASLGAQLKRSESR